MRYIKQFSIILAISFLGEVINRLVPLPVPAGIYALLLMLLCLQMKLFSSKAVKEVGTFLVEIMPIMFIPAAVGLLPLWTVFKPVLVPFVVITVVSTFLVMIVTGRVTQMLIRLDKRRNPK